MSWEASWRNLELRVAQYFERNGYEARTNQKERGRSGLVHEIDVLAEKRDAAGTHRVAVECKAWRTPVEKDVIYKLERVMQDAGLSMGIVVSAGGLRAGARVAAEQARIEVWGPDEIRHHLGEEALAGLPLTAPDEGLGIAVEINQEAAEREIRKARGGFAGLGADEVVSVDLMWIPAFELHLAVTRVRPGVIKDREEVVPRWNLFEALTGRLIGEQQEPRPFANVALDGPSLRAQKSPAQIVADMRRTLAKHSKARTDAALRARQEAYNALGLPGSTRQLAIEGEHHVFVPYYVGLLRRRSSERLIAVHAGNGARSESLEQALHEKIDLVRRALEPAAPSVAPVTPPPEQRIEATDRLARATEPSRTCTCGAGMVLRRRKSDNEPFWGCSTFPRCRHTQQIP